MNAARPKTVLSFCCHPDDTEFMCAGTLALLKEKGWDVRIATMARGDCGSATQSREEIAKIRREEATRAAAILDGTYHCADCDDVLVCYDRETILRAVAIVRQVRPSLVFAPSPTDYMVDHEHTSKLLRTACFAAGIPNLATPGAAPFEPVPHLYYVDPLGGHDNFGEPIVPGMMVDISAVIDTKEKMLCCHASQRNWLMAHHGIDEYVISMRNFDKERGERIGAAYGEGFRQHLGHAFPSNNLLKEALGELVHEL